MIYCETFGKCHNVPPPSITIIIKKKTLNVMLLVRKWPKPYNKSQSTLILKRFSQFGKRKSSLKDFTKLDYATSTAIQKDILGHFNKNK
jgi:hypothetical protein